MNKTFIPQSLERLSRQSRIFSIVLKFSIFYELLRPRVFDLQYNLIKSRATADKQFKLS